MMECRSIRGKMLNAPFVVQFDGKNDGWCNSFLFFCFVAHVPKQKPDTNLSQTSKKGGGIAFFIFQSLCDPEPEKNGILYNKNNINKNEPRFFSSLCLLIPRGRKHD